LPSVTLKLSGMPSSGFTASMVFTNASSSTYNRTYEFTANNQEKKQDIGGGINGSTYRTNPKIFPAGIQTVRTIVVNYGGVDYTVTLSNPVTISQPQYPAYVDFTDIKSIESSFTGTTPSRIVGTPQADGTFTVTLPGSQTWTEEKSESKTENEKTISGPSQIATYYETWTEGWIWKTDKYQEYREIVMVTQADEVLTTYTRTYKITGWKVGNTTYDVGETITITGNQTISAVIGYTDGDKTMGEYIVTITTTYYETGDDMTGDPPGSTIITTDQANEMDNYPQSNPKVETSRVPKS